jgi:hypothetical protein
MQGPTKTSQRDHLFLFPFSGHKKLPSHSERCWNEKTASWAQDQELVLWSYRRRPCAASSHRWQRARVPSFQLDVRRPGSGGFWKLPLGRGTETQVKSAHTASPGMLNRP